MKVLRKPIIAANWKMYKTLSEARSFIEEIRDHVPSKEKLDTVVCPPALFLRSLVKLTENTPVDIGSQNMHFKESGAFTGEISPVALADLGVKYVILGHSERRQLFHETNEDVNKKTLAAFEHGLIPIVCCGETFEQREKGQTLEHIQNQVKRSLDGLTADQMKQTVLAYEPIWAIGTGKASTAEDANEVCAIIRNAITDHFSKDVAQFVRIQYGGSVKPSNIAEFMSQPDIDGALVGGASLEPKSFLQLLEAGQIE